MKKIFNILKKSYFRHLNNSLTNDSLSNQDEKNAGSKFDISLIPAAAPGGIGDDAMINGSVAGIFEIHGNKTVSILVEKKFNEQQDSLRDDVTYKNIIAKNTMPSEIIKEARYSTSLVVLGADIMDGHYSIFDARRRIKTCKMANEIGIRSRVIGFSLNDQPSKSVIDEFNSLKGRTPLYLRDHISHDRAIRMIDGDIRLSADVAFLLKPNPSGAYTDVASFTNSNHSENRLIIGINIHQLLYGKSEVSKLKKLAESIANLINNQKFISFVFIPHDFRDYVDDRIPHKYVQDFLTTEALSRCFFLTEKISAGQIKAICGLLDGVFTARMHLAIAALGMKIPVAGIVYQGKFEGTFAHFNLDTCYTIYPDDAADNHKLAIFFERWISDLNYCKNKIELNLDSVIEKAKSNFYDL